MNEDDILDAHEYLTNVRRQQMEAAQAAFNKPLPSPQRKDLETLFRSLVSQLVIDRVEQ